MAGRSKFQEQQRQELFASYNYACGKCGSMLDLEEDHIIPRKMQEHFPDRNLDSRENMQCLCHSCNNAKNGKFDAENHDRYKYGPRMPSHIQLLSAIETLENRGTEKALAELKLIKEHHNV